jgi:carbamoylphosphate synthase small subunit
VLREDATAAASWRAQYSIDRWLKDRNLIGIAAVDTRRLVNRIRDQGAPKGCLAFAPRHSASPGGSDSAGTGTTTTTTGGANEVVACGAITMPKVMYCSR